MPKNLSLARERAGRLIAALLECGAVDRYYEKLVQDVDEKQLLTVITQEIERITQAQSVSEVAAPFIQSLDAAPEIRANLNELDDLVKRCGDVLVFIIKDLKIIFLDLIAEAAQHVASEREDEVKRKITEEQEAFQTLQQERQDLHQQISDVTKKVGELSLQMNSSHLERKAWVEFCCDTLPLVLSTYKAQTSKQQLQVILASSNLETAFSQLLQLLDGDLLVSADLTKYIRNPDQPYKDKDLETLKKIISANIEPPVVCDRTNDILEFSGNHFLLSELLSRPELNLPILQSKSGAKIIARGTVYVDCDLTDERWRGKNIAIFAAKIEVLTKHTMDVSGHNASQYVNTKAKDGNLGLNGEDGEPGPAGESAGNICLKATSFVNLDGLTTVANGGDGSNGQDGGNGGKGQDGYDGKDGKAKELSGTTDVVALDPGTHASPGKCGGNGGRAGHGGEGGFGGNILVYQVDRRGHQTLLHEERGINGRQGENGKCGIGGEGGKAGIDGVDDGYAWLSRGWGWRGEYIHKRGLLEKENVHHSFGWDSADLHVLKTEEAVKQAPCQQAQSGVSPQEFTTRDDIKTKAIAKPRIDHESVEMRSGSSIDVAQVMLDHDDHSSLQAELGSQVALKTTLEAQDTHYEEEIVRSSERQKQIGEKRTFLEKIKYEIGELYQRKISWLKSFYTEHAVNATRVAGYEVETDVSSDVSDDVSHSMKSQVDEKPAHDPSVLLKAAEVGLQQINVVYATELEAAFERINVQVISQSMSPDTGIKLKRTVINLLHQYEAKEFDPIQIKFILQNILPDIGMCLELEHGYSKNQKKGRTRFCKSLKSTARKLNCEVDYLTLLCTLSSHMDAQVFESLHADITRDLAINGQQYTVKQKQFLRRLIAKVEPYKKVKEFQERFRAQVAMEEDEETDSFSNGFCNEFFYWLLGANINVDEYCSEIERNLSALAQEQDFTSHSLHVVQERAKAHLERLLYRDVYVESSVDGEEIAAYQQLVQKFPLDSVDDEDDDEEDQLESFAMCCHKFLETFKRNTTVKCLRIILAKLNFENIPFALKDLNEIFNNLVELNNTSFAVNLFLSLKPQHWLDVTVFETLQLYLQRIFPGKDMEVFSLLKRIQKKPEILRILRIKVLELQNSLLEITWDEFKATLELLQKIDTTDRTIIDVPHLSKQPLFAFKHILETSLLLTQLPVVARKRSYIHSIESRFGLAILTELLDIVHSRCGPMATPTECEQVCAMLGKIADGRLMLAAEVLRQIRTVPIAGWENILMIYTRSSKNRMLSLPELLEAMRSTNFQNIEGVDGFLETLKQDITTIRTKVTSRSEILTLAMPIAEFSEENISQWARLVNLEVVRRNPHEVVAVICRAVKLKFNFEPHLTQLIALWLFTKDINQKINKLGQIATGEGKTLIVAMCAIFKALTGKHVDVVTSSCVLAQRDMKTNQPLFALFNLETATNSDEESRKTTESRKKSYNHHVVYGDVGSFQADILSDEFFDEEIRMGRGCNCLILDEVDSMMLDKCQHVLYLSHPINELGFLRDIFLHIWNAVNASDVDPNQEEKYVEDIMLCIQDSIEQGGIVIPSTLQEFVNLKLETWIHNAFIARRLEADDPYTTKHGICIIDKDTGVSETSTQWEDGLHQFLQLKHSDRLTATSLKAVFMSNYSYFRRYDEIIGLSGTLGSFDSRNLLRKAYHFELVFHLPRTKQRFFIEDEGLICSTEEEWLAQTEHEIISHLNGENPRALLVICESIKYAKLISKRLKACEEQHHYGLIRFKYMKSEQTFDIGTDQKPLQGKDVIIATNLAGRGTDLKVSSEVERNGGLHVIVTFMPPNTRVKDQAFGRASRKGENGSGKFILCSTHQQLLSAEAAVQMGDLEDLVDDLERVRLKEAEILELPHIEIQEELLKRYKVLCAQVKTVLATEEKDYRQLQLLSLQNHWAFWLDKIETKLKTLNSSKKDARTQSTAALLEMFLPEFEQFSQKMLELSRRTDVFKLITQFEEIHRLGMYYKTHKGFDKAVICFDKLIEANQEFSEKAHYYKAACLLEEKPDAEKQSVKRHLQKAKFLMEKRIIELSHSLTLLTAANRQRIQQGADSSHYEDQMRKEIDLHHIHVHAIDEIIGVPIQSEMFLYKFGVDDKEQSARLYDFVRSNPGLAKNFRVSKKVFIEGDTLFVTRENGLREKFLTREPTDVNSCRCFDLLKSKVGHSDFRERSVEQRDFNFEGMTAKEVELGFNSLIMKGIIKQPTIVFPLRNAATQDAIEARTNQLKESLRAMIIEKYGKDNCERYLTDIMTAFDMAIGKLKTLPKIKVSYQSIEAFFQTGEFPPEIRQFQEILFSDIIQFAEQKPWWNWGAFSVAMLGVAQIIAGVAIEIYSGGIGVPIGNALVGEGFNDILYAIVAMMNQDFSWKNYLQNKVINVALSATCVGVGVWAERVRKAKKAAQGTQAVVAEVHEVQKICCAGSVRSNLTLFGKTLAKETCKKVAPRAAMAIVTWGAGQAFDSVYKYILKNFLDRINNFLGQELSTLEKNMISLYEASYEEGGTFAEGQAWREVKHLYQVLERERLAATHHVFTFVRSVVGDLSAHCDDFSNYASLIQACQTGLRRFELESIFHDCRKCILNLNAEITKKTNSWRASGKSTQKTDVQREQFGIEAHRYVTEVKSRMNDQLVSEMKSAFFQPAVQKVFSYGMDRVKKKWAKAEEVKFINPKQSELEVAQKGVDLGDSSHLMEVESKAPAVQHDLASSSQRKIAPGAFTFLGKHKHREASIDSAGGVRHREKLLATGLASQQFPFFPSLNPKRVPQTSRHDSHSLITGVIATKVS